MCGIAGFFGGEQEASSEIAKKMATAISHRGPDDVGIWVDQDKSIAFSHRRLSILDLTSAGHQPMLSACEKFVIIFNGEIYNHLEIRRKLESSAMTTVNDCKIHWRGHSDTETLLVAISSWGIDATLKECVGMFALALWNRENQTLILARDRLGEKPLYYGKQGGTFLFGSELKALKCHPAFKAEIDRDAMALYLRHNYIPAPYSIYKDIHKLKPGTYLECSMESTIKFAVKEYWSFAEVAKFRQRNLFKGSEIEAQNELERLLSQSIRGQIVADVPVGAFLSGGIDSSTLVAIMQTQMNIPVKTFTIGFSEEGYNEAGYANKVAKHLQSDHTELYVSPEQAISVIPMLPQIYDEPFADSSQIPTWLVSKLAKEKVSVCLTGDGADEFFAGYNRYFLGQQLWNKIRLLPPQLRKKLANFIVAISADQWNTGINKILPIVPINLRFENPGDKLHKLASALQSATPENLYLGLVSHWKDPTNIILDSKEPISIFSDQNLWSELADFEQRMMGLDTISYLPDDILVKVDRAAMSLGLETRVPFLDYRIVEFAWSLPLSMKIQKDQGKFLLRNILYKHVPKNLIDRPKMGFGIPLDIWLRGPLKEWAESLLDNNRLKQEGFFNPIPIRKKWEEHLSGERNWQYHLWDILMFQTWLEQNH